MINFIAFIQIAIMAALLGFVAGVVCCETIIRERCPEQWNTIEKDLNCWLSEMKESMNYDK